MKGLEEVGLMAWWWGIAKGILWWFEEGADCDKPVSPSQWWWLDAMQTIFTPSCVIISLISSGFSLFSENYTKLTNITYN